MNGLSAKIKHNYLLLVLLGVAALLIFAYAWIPGGLDTDSCNYAVVAKEILHTNKWLGLYDPVYQGVFYYHFPLCIWITAGLFKFLGVSTFTAKLFSMFSALVLTAAIFYLGRLLKNQWVGFFSGISFLMTNHIVRLSRQCRMDIPVTLFISLALLCFILAQKRSRLYYILFGLFTCLAIFTKDVFGLAPLVIVFMYLLIRLDWRQAISPLFILGLLIASGPVIMWIWLDRQSLLIPWWRWNFLHLLRAPNFSVPWYYYIWSIATKYFYFLPFAIYGGYLAVKEARQKKNYVFYILMIWVFIFPLAFSFGRQKLHYFVLPMYPAASLLVGMALDETLKEPVKLKIAAALKYILIVASIVMRCLPIKMQSKRFIETVRLAPVIDQILKQLPEYEFMVYNQDSAALLFYSQELKRVKNIHNQVSLGEALVLSDNRPRFCYLSEEDLARLSPSARQSFRTILKYKDRIIISNQKDPAFFVTLP